MAPISGRGHHQLQICDAITDLVLPELIWSECHPTVFDDALHLNSEPDDVTGDAHDLPVDQRLGWRKDVLIWMGFFWWPFVGCMTQIRGPPNGGTRQPSCWVLLG